MNKVATMPKHDLEVASPAGQPLADMAMVVGLTRAEIDQQISTARQYPRSIAQAARNITALATLDEETADSCMYAVPRGGKTIEGPSIRFAEIVQQCWGNNRVAARVVFVDKAEKYLEAEGIYHDLETNAATMARVRRSIVDRSGRVYKDDMILITGNAASSIARRNAILAGVPRPIWYAAYQEARKVVMGDIQTLANRRASALTELQKFGITADQVFALLEVKGEADIDPEKLVVLRGAFRALKSGETTVEALLGDILKPVKAIERPKPEDYTDVKAGETVNKETGEITKGEPQPEVPLDEVLAASGDDTVSVSSASDENEKTDTPAIDNRLQNARHLGTEAHKAGKPLMPPAGMADEDEKRAYKAGWEDADKAKRKAAGK